MNTTIKTAYPNAASWQIVQVFTNAFGWERTSLSLIGAAAYKAEWICAEISDEAEVSA